MPYVSRQPEGAGEMTIEAATCINHGQPGSFPRGPGRRWVSVVSCAVERKQSIGSDCSVDCQAVTGWEHKGGRGGWSLPSMGFPAGDSQTIHSKQKKWAVQFCNKLGEKVERVWG